MEDGSIAEEGVALTAHCHCGDCGWHLLDQPQSVIACNCSLCRRYGGLWAYGPADRIRMTGSWSTYTRADRMDPTMEVRFCPRCGTVIGWVALRPEASGARTAGVNVRLADFERVAHLRVHAFDGADTFDEIDRPRMQVRHLWF